MKDLRDKWALITGAGSGIGRALAVEFTSHGSNIIISDINEEGMAGTAALVEEHGGRAICIRADISRKEDVEALAKRALEQAGRVDILANNAGIVFVSEMKDTLWEEWEKILAVNLRGHIMLTHCLLPHMVKRGSGHIVNTASMAGLMAFPGIGPYTTTKFGMVGFSIALRYELAAHGIGVTVACPGIVHTPIISSAPIRGFSLNMKNISPKMMITPAQAARTIVRAVRRNKARVIPGKPFTWLVFALDRLFPGLTEFAFKKAYARWERAPISKA